MELQTSKGIFSARANLVLHHDVEVHPSGGYSFTSVISEETSKDGDTPIFHSSGTGYQEQQDAFTFIDFLLELNDLPQIDLEMAAWVFECEDSGPGLYTVRYQIRDQVTYIKGPGIPEPRLLPSSTPTGFPNLVQESNHA